MNITHNAATIRKTLKRLIHHRTRMIRQGRTHHEVAQRKSIATLTKMLGHTPATCSTQQMLNRIHQYRADIRTLNYCESSKYHHKREEINALLQYALKHYKPALLERAGVFSPSKGEMSAAGGQRGRGVHSLINQSLITNH